MGSMGATGFGNTVEAVPGIVGNTIDHAKVIAGAVASFVADKRCVDVYISLSMPIRQG